jgi:hypothetical protein
VHTVSRLRVLQTRQDRSISASDSVLLACVKPHVSWLPQLLPHLLASADTSYRKSPKEIVAILGSVAFGSCEPRDNTYRGARIYLTQYWYNDPPTLAIALRTRSFAFLERIIKLRLSLQQIRSYSRLPLLGVSEVAKTSPELLHRARQLVFT